MWSVEAATTIINEHTKLVEEELIPLDQANQRVLREPIFADRDFPPFNRVAMDGIALQYQEIAAGKRAFPIIGMVPAGAPPIKLNRPDAAIEVATGAMLPEGTDTIIPYEQIRISDGTAFVESNQVLAGQHVHRQGSDRPKDAILLAPNKLIGPAEMSILATVGKPQLLVSRRIRIAILATGDELVKIEATPLPWQIRQSNPSALQSLLSQQPVMVQTFFVKDDFNQAKNLVEKILSEYDLLVLSGGVSAGKRDFIPELLQQVGVEILLHKVTQRPGKPLLFGQAPDGPTVFALPGNPVSAFMCTCRYVIPWIRRCQGLDDYPMDWAFLAQPLQFKPDLTWFVPVHIKNESGILRAYPQPGQGSGDLANLEAADGFLELPKGRDEYGIEEAFRLFRYR